MKALLAAILLTFVAGVMTSAYAEPVKGFVFITGDDTEYHLGDTVTLDVEIVQYAKGGDPPAYYGEEAELNLVLWVTDSNYKGTYQVAVLTTTITPDDQQIEIYLDPDSVLGEDAEYSAITVVTVDGSISNEFVETFGTRQYLNSFTIYGTEEITPDPYPTYDTEPTPEPLPELTDADLTEIIPDPEPIPQTNSWEQKYNDIVSMMSATADKLGDAEKKLEKAEKKLDQSQQSFKDLKKQMNNFNTAELESLQQQNKDLKEKIDNLNALVMEQVKVIYKWVLNN